jgi:hypothetical protein
MRARLRRALSPRRRHADFAQAGAAAVHAMRKAVGNPRVRTVELTEEYLADTIADVLHLAVTLEMDPDEVLEHGRSYFEGDGEEL